MEREQNYKGHNHKGFEASIVIPCYNEENRLHKQAFLDFLENHQNVEFIFVNDGSRDNTLALLNEMQQMNPVQIRVLDLEMNSGKAEAVRQGMQLASESDVELVGFWDADLATPLCAIDDFLKIAHRLPDVEVVYGARNHLLGHRIQRTFKRRVISRTCAFLARLATKLPVSDTQCGAKIFRNTDALQSTISKKFTAAWLFDVEIFSRLSRQMVNTDGKFYEFPLYEWNEVPGSKVDMKAVISSGLVMVRLIGQNRLGLFAAKRSYI